MNLQNVRRIFVEKKAEFDVAVQELYIELKEFLEIKGLKRVRIIQRYDVEGITQEVYEKSRETIFSEPPVDNVYDEEFEIPDETRVIAIEYLPGQYDQRADSAAQCIQILTHGEKPEIRCAKLILLYGELSEKDYGKIKDYCINPLESRETSLVKQDTLKMQIEYPKEVKTLTGFIKKEEKELKEMYGDLNLAMSFNNLLFIQKY